MELPKELQTETLVLCKVNEPIPVAYFNVYEVGDIWIKIKGCESCSEEGKERCCRGCAMQTPKGCLLHLTRPAKSEKPYRCVIHPMPNKVISWCALEFKCVQGKHKGRIRKVREPDWLREECLKK